MTWFAPLCRLLAAILVVGLAVGPLAPAATAVGAAAPHIGVMADAAMPAGMDCCPDQSAATADCDLSCPAAAMCVAKCLPAQPGAGRADAMTGLAPWRAPAPADPDGLASAPPGHPPKRQGVAAA